jgi:hypothetical protein
MLDACVYGAVYPLLSTSSAKTFPRQGKINGSVVFYAVLVIEKESDYIFPELIVFNLLACKYIEISEV